MQTSRCEFYLDDGQYIMVASCPVGSWQIFRRHSPGGVGGKKCILQGLSCSEALELASSDPRMQVASRTLLLMNLLLFLKKN